MSVDFFGLHRLFDVSEGINIQPTFGVLNHNNPTHVLLFSTVNLILLSILFQQYNSSKDKRFQSANILKFAVLASVSSVLLALNIIFISNLVDAYL